MASPQLNGGYTRISNEILKSICTIHNSSWIKIALWTVRITYGFHRKENESNYGAYATVTKLTRETIKSAMLDMSDRLIITLVPTSKGRFIISFNKDWEKWKV